MKTFEEHHIIINSNKWFSAVSAYSWQMALFFSINKKIEVWTHKKSPLSKLCLESKINHKEFPVLDGGVFYIFSCWKILNTELLKHKNAYTIVWTFEGREHTICSLHRYFNKNKWKNTKLVRIRGQAAFIKNNFFSKWVYNSGVDSVVLASKIIENKFPFHLKNTCIFPYCSQKPTKTEIDSPLPEWFPKDSINFLFLGRFDPVKNHKNTILSYYYMITRKTKTSLLCVGRSENIKFHELVEFSKKLFSKIKYQDNTIAILSTNDELKSVYIIDRKLNNISSLIHNCHFGVISSLDSEVICRVAVEFLLVGRPLIVSDAGSLPEVVKNTPCLIFDRNSNEDLKNKLDLALDLCLDNKKFSAICKICLNYGNKNFSNSRYDLLNQWVLKNWRSHESKYKKNQ